MENNRKRIDEIDMMMARLFELRMSLVKEISKYKKEHNLPILDLDRQQEIISKNCEVIQEEYHEYYRDFIENLMRISREFQENE